MRKYDEPPAALLLRQLAESKQKERVQDERQRDEKEILLDNLWLKNRDEYGPKVVAPARGEIFRLAKAAAERGGLSLHLDLGVNEDRLRISSGVKEFAFAEAALAEKAVLSPKWAYLGRLGWLIQTRDGQKLSEPGQALMQLLAEMGFRLHFTPHYVKDHFANPYFNATLDLDW